MPINNLTENPLQVAVSLVELKLRNIDNIPEEERELIRRLVGTISLLPNRYKTGSDSSYYQQKYAEQAKLIYDRILNDPDHKTILLDASKAGLSKNTLQQRMFQAKSFLLERLDPDKTYAEISKKIKIRRHQRGVIFEWQKDTLDMLEMDELVEERPEVSWRDKLDLFIEHATEGSQLELKLQLSTPELMELKSMLWDIKDRFVPLAVHCDRLLLRCDSVLAKAAKGTEE